MADHPAIELLASIEHDRWSRWMRWVYQNGAWNPDGSFTIVADRAQRWSSLAATDYFDLDDPTKEYDREEVRRTLAALEQSANQEGEPDPDCPYCDENGIATSPVTGAIGRCRHPLRDPARSANQEGDRG